MSKQRAVEISVSPIALLRMLSIIIPVFNEQDNLHPLLSSLLAVLRQIGRPFEIIAINDGSRDKSLERLREIADVTPELKVINLKRNYGQTAAIMAGIDHAKGSILIPIDADLQNDPADIPVLLEKLEQGFDVVSGWRKNRQDHAVRRTFLSKVANRLISWISGVHLNDYGCTLKVYRSNVIKGVRLYGEMHRFIPIYATWQGARVTELPVRHRPRLHGTSNYGLERIIKVILDLMFIKFMGSYLTKPLYIFGGIGAASILCSFLIILLVICAKLFRGISMIQTPLPLLSVMLFITGVMTILMGFLAELIVRTYFESQTRDIYSIRDTINMDGAS